MMYRMIAISNALPPDKRRKYLEDSRKMLKQTPQLGFGPEGCQLGFGFGPEGNVYLTAPLWRRYFWGSPDNKVDGLVTEKEMFYERRSNVPEVVRNFWLKMFPPRKVGLYLEV